MKLSKLFTTSLIALCLSLPIAACDGDDGDTGTDTTAAETTGATDTTGAAETTGTTAPSEDTTCPVFCVGYLQICVESGMSMEFPNDAECNAACEAWDQAGKNCRYEQVIAGACGEAGNAGSTC